MFVYCVFRASNGSDDEQRKKFLASSGLEGRDLSKLNKAEQRDADWFERQAQVALNHAFITCSFIDIAIYAYQLC
jgi:hypothetical protein